MIIHMLILMFTAMIWSAILGIDVTPNQAIKCMIGVKLSRLTETPDHQDSIDDIADYTLCLKQVINVLEGVDVET